MTQADITAWISAGAAVVQAIGAVLAIWFSIKIARDADRRSMESDRAAVERERAAETASVARAEAAERRAEEREKVAQAASAAREEEALRRADARALLAVRNRRQQLVNLIAQEVAKLMQDVEEKIRIKEAVPNTFIGGEGNGQNVVSLIESLKMKMEDPDLLAPLSEVERAAALFPPRVSAAGWAYAVEHRRFLDVLSKAMEELKIRGSAVDSVT